MTDNMTRRWLTLEKVALTLNISLRTLHRWIDNGKVETRLSDGRREALVDCHDDDVTQGDTDPQTQYWADACGRHGQ